MGNTEIKAHFEQVKKEGSSLDQLGLTEEILLQDSMIESVYSHLRTKLSQKSDLNFDKAFPIHNNTISDASGSGNEQKACLKAFNEYVLVGFASPQDNVQILQDSDSAGSVKTTIERQKFLLLYAMFLERTLHSSQKERNFFELINSELAKTSVSSHLEVGLQTALQLAIGLLKEVDISDNLSEARLLSVLQQLHYTLSHAKDGCFFGRDGFSFALDANLNEARRFLVSVIEAHNTTKQKICQLALSVLVQLGRIRSNPEDYLIVACLMQKISTLKLSTSDLDHVFRRLEGQSSSNSIDVKQVLFKKVVLRDAHLFFYMAGNFATQITHADALCSDGRSVYHFKKGKGLFKLQVALAKKSARMPGCVKDANTEASVANLDVCAIVVFNEKLLLRHPGCKPAPFSVFCPASLKEDLVESKRLKDQFEKEAEAEKAKQAEKQLEQKNEVYRSLMWHSDKVRSLENSPLFTDGRFLYAAAISKPESSDSKSGCVVEWYDQDLKFKNCVTLKDKEEKPFEVDESKLGRFATNGTQIALILEGRTSVFDLESGAKLDELKDKNSFGTDSVCYDHVNNSFNSFSVSTSSLQQVRITGFSQRAGEDLSQEQQAVVFESQRMQSYLRNLKPAKQDSEKEKSVSEMNAVEQIMFDVSSAQLLACAESSEHQSMTQHNEKVKRMLILKHLAVSSQTLSDKMSKASSFTAKAVLESFKSADATYLTCVLFKQLQQCLEQATILISSEKNATNLPDQYSLLYAIQVLHTNFQALSSCGISLPALIKSDYNAFLQAYKECVVSLIEDGYSSSFVGTEAEVAEMVALWHTIKQACVDIMKNSVNLLYPDAQVVLATLLAQLKSVADAKQGLSCSILLDFVSKPENQMHLFELKSTEELSVVQQVFDRCLLVEQNFFEQAEAANPCGATVFKVRNGSIFELSCQNFVRSFAKSLLAKHSDLVETSQSNELIDQLVSFVFRRSCEEVVSLVRKTSSALEKATKSTEVSSFLRFMQNLVFEKNPCSSTVVLCSTVFAQTSSNLTVLTQLLSSSYSLLAEMATLFAQIQSFPALQKKESLEACTKDFNSFGRSLVILRASIASYFTQCKLKIDAPHKEGDAEKVESQLLQTNLLSGGIEDKFEKLFSQSTKTQIADIQSICGPTQKSAENNDLATHQFLLAVLKAKEAQLQSGKLVQHCQATYSKTEGVAKAMVGGSHGESLTRAAFAVALKLSGLVDKLAETEFDSTLLSEKEAAQLQQMYNKASQMRAWTQDVKRELAEKIETEETQKFLLEKKKRIAKQDAADQAFQSIGSLSEAEKASIQVEADRRFDLELVQIFDSVAEKAFFLIQLQAPASSAFSEESAKEFVEAAEEPNQQEKGDASSKKESSQQSCVQAVLTILKVSCSVQILQRLVETVHLKAQQRVAGLKLFADLFALDLPETWRNDCVRWFCSSLRNNTNQACHYLDGIEGCGNTLEKQARSHFFLVLKALVSTLGTVKTKQQAELILQALNWKFTGRDHFSIAKIQLFTALHQSEFLRIQWGKSVENNFHQPGNGTKCSNFAKNVLSLFETLTLSVVERLLQSDEGSVINLKVQGQIGVSSIPAMNRQKSIISENASDLLLQKAFAIIFEEAGRFVRILQTSKGIDWVLYTQKRSLLGERLISDDELDQLRLLDLSLPAPQSKEEEEKKHETEVDKEATAEPSEKTEEQIKAHKSKHEEILLKEAQSKNEEIMKDKVRMVARLYSESFLLRLLRLVELFTSVVRQESAKNLLSMVTRVATPAQIKVLMQLLVVASPKIRFTVTSIFKNLVLLKLPMEVFEQAARQVEAEPRSFAGEVLTKMQPSVRFTKSKFLAFLFQYTLSVRQKVMVKSELESEGSYEVSGEIVRLMRLMFESTSDEDHPWRKEIQTVLLSVVTNIREVSAPREVEVLLSLVRGCEFQGLAPYSQIEYNGSDRMTLIGFVERNWLTRSRDSGKTDVLVNDSFSSDQQRVLAYNHSSKGTEKLKLVLPFAVKVLHMDSANDVENKANQFKLTPATLDKLLSSSGLLREDQKISSQDIQQLTLSLQLLKLVNHQIKTADNFIDVLKKSGHYESLLKFVCKEASVEMKGDIILLDWLEQLCFSIRKFACENQTSLVKHQETQLLLVKDKLYAAAINPHRKNDKNFKRVCLRHALNFEAFEQRKEVSITHQSNVFVSKSEEAVPAQNQVVLIEEDAFQEGGDGIDLLNCSSAAITPFSDLNALVVRLRKLQKEQPERYSTILQKPVFVVSDQGFRTLCELCQGGQPVSEDQSQEAEDFDSAFASQAVKFGGIDRNIAKKTLAKSAILDKTSLLVQMTQLLQDGQLALDDGADSESQAKDIGVKTLKRTEDLWSVRQKLTRNFEEVSNGNSSPPSEQQQDAMLRALLVYKTESDLPLLYQKSLQKLFSLYCRHIFWNLIQKDNIEQVFSFLLVSDADVEAFSTFLNVLGNECFITQNKTNIRDFKGFLTKVMATGCRNKKFTRLIECMVFRKVVDAYSSRLLELNDSGRNSELPTQYIETFFKTESKAAQLMNPYILTLVVKQVAEEGFKIVKPRVADLISILLAVNYSFFGSQKNKEKMLWIVNVLLGKIIQHKLLFSKQEMLHVLNLQIFDVLAQQTINFVSSEATTVLDRVQDDESEKIDDTNRTNTEKLLFNQQPRIHKKFQEFSRDNWTLHKQIVFEILQKLLQLSNALGSPCLLPFKDNLMLYSSLQSELLEQGCQSGLNKHLLFCSSLSNEELTQTTTFETTTNLVVDAAQTPFTCAVGCAGVNKFFFKLRENTSFHNLSAQAMLSADPEGRQPLRFFDKHQVEKSLAFTCVYASQAFLHYPVSASQQFKLELKNETVVPLPLARTTLNARRCFQLPFRHRVIQRYEDMFVAEGHTPADGDLKLFTLNGQYWEQKYEQFSFKQIQIGKQCKVFLTLTGEVLADGTFRNSFFADCIDLNAKTVTMLPIVLADKKNQVVQISLNRRLLLAVTSNGKVLFASSKFAKSLKIEFAGKFGFQLLPIEETETKAAEKLVEESKSEAIEEVESKELEDDDENADENFEENKAEQLESTAEVKLVEPTKEPVLTAVQCWTSKGCYGKEQVAIVLFKNSESGFFEFRTAGKNSFGLLGQGPDVKESLTLKKVDFGDVQIRSLDEFVVGYKHVLVRINGMHEVFAWGTYMTDNEERMLFKPQPLPFFNGRFQVLKLASGDCYTVALVREVAKDAEETVDDKPYLISGQFAPFVSENKIRKSKDFQGAEVDLDSLFCYSSTLYLSTVGSLKHDQPAITAVLHTQSCFNCKKQISGLVHCFPQAEDIAFTCYDCLHLVTNPLLVAFKRPVATETLKSTLKWAELETTLNQGVAHSENLVYTAVGNKVTGEQLSAEEVAQPTIYDKNLAVFICSKIPVHGEKLETFASLPTELIQGLTGKSFTISFNITPDYKFKEHLKLREVHKDKYSAMQTHLAEIDKLNEAARKKFHAKLEQYAIERCKDCNLGDVQWTEKSIIEGLTFDDEALDELSADCKHTHLMLLASFCQMLWGHCSFISTRAHKTAGLVIYTNFTAFKHNIPSLIKNKLLRLETRDDEDKDPTVSVHLKRLQAREKKAAGKVDDKGEWTVFASIARKLQTERYRGMRTNSAVKSAWFVKLVGEQSIDGGGPFRESITEMCLELQSECLPLFVPSGNQKSGLGENRDKWVVNPQSLTERQLLLWEFLGACIGMSIRSGILLSLNLAETFWKQLTDETISEADLKRVDEKFITNFSEFRRWKAEGKPESEFRSTFGLTMTTLASNGQVLKLAQDGSNVPVTYENLEEFIRKSINARLSEGKQQIKALKKGLNHTLSAPYLKFLSWKDLERKVVGNAEIDIERLKEITDYKNCSADHAVVKRFWKTLTNFDPDLRTAYLRFVWGRTRLPLPEDDVVERHQVKLLEGDSQNHLPVGRTCFFQLELPAYSSDDLMRDKITYAITQSSVINADGDAFVVRDIEEIQAPEFDEIDAEFERERLQRVSEEELRRIEEMNYGGEEEEEE